MSISKKEFDKMPNPSISARLTVYVDGEFDKKEIENAFGLKAKFCKQKSEMKISPITNKKPSGYIAFCAKEQQTRNENDVVLPMIDYLYEKKDSILAIESKYNARFSFLVEVLLNSFKDSTLNLSFDYIKKLQELHFALEHEIEF